MKTKLFKIINFKQTQILNAIFYLLMCHPCGRQLIQLGPVNKKVQDKMIWRLECTLMKNYHQELLYIISWN